MNLNGKSWWFAEGIISRIKIEEASQVYEAFVSTIGLIYDALASTFYN